MIDIKVYNREGEELESLQVDEALFGGTSGFAQAGDCDVPRQ